VGGWGIKTLSDVGGREGGSELGGCGMRAGKDKVKDRCARGGGGCQGK